MTRAGTRAAQRAESARRIREAARVEFGEHGYDGATIRAIAARAGVDASLVMQHFGSKQSLFASAVRLDVGTTDGVESHLRDVVLNRVTGLPPEMHALARSMLTVPAATTAMRGHLDERAANLASAMGGEDAELRGALLCCAILGLTVGRHFLHLTAFDGVTEEKIAEVAGAFLNAAVTAPQS